jgi:hypothetical protein
MKDFLSQDIVIHFEKINSQKIQSNYRLMLPEKYEWKSVWKISLSTFHLMFTWKGTM